MHTQSTYIKDNIGMTIDAVRQKNPNCADPLRDMILTKIEEQRDTGWNIAYMGSLFSMESTFFWTEDGVAYPKDNHERRYFYLVKLDQSGEIIDVCAFLVIDLTAGTVTDCSHCIATIH